MPRVRFLAGAVALALGVTATAQAQEFSGVVVFGDSLSDAGNIAAAQGLPPGNSFTTNPDPVAVELIAANYGLTTGPSLAGGSDFAWGGACVTAAGPCLNPVPRLGTQIGQYLTATGGSADPNALYSYWGGANDLFANLAFASVGAIPSTQVAPNVQQTAIEAIGQIGTLQAVGADTIVVFNLPDIGLAPQFFGTANQATVSQLSALYNATLNAGLAQLGEGIVPINTFGLIGDLIANPTLYGLTNVTGQACGAGSSSVACGPEGSGLPFTYAPGTNETWLFADGVHPTGIAHQILANVVVATLEAPQQVSLAAEGALKTYADHSRSLNEQIMGGQRAERPDGSVRAWAGLQGGSFDIDGSAANPGLDGDSTTLSVGAEYRFNEHFALGGAASFGQTDGDIDGGGNNKVNDNLLALYGVARFGGGFVAAVVSGGSADYDINRTIQLGAFRRTDNGDTSGTHSAYEFSAGWLFRLGSVQTGPFASYTAQSVDVDGYREFDSSTALWFDGFERESEITRVGWTLTGTIGSEAKFLPYANVSWASEGKDDPIRVVAGSTSMNGFFGRDGFTPSDDWIDASVGFNWAFTDTITGFFGYNGRFSDDQQDGDSLNVGVHMAL